jgi:ATP-binding cassette, subfamily C (CFTR/MRP), member 1
MTTQIRGYLISTIYDTVLQQESANDNQNNAMTLMSTDVEQICLTLKNLHEIWATFLELCIATYLLERQMKVACIVPLIIVLGTFHP